MSPTTSKTRSKKKKRIGEDEDMSHVTLLGFNLFPYGTFVFIKESRKINQKLQMWVSNSGLRRYLYLFDHYTKS